MNQRSFSQRINALKLPLRQVENVIQLSKMPGLNHTVRLIKDEKL